MNTQYLDRDIHGNLPIYKYWMQPFYGNFITYCSARLQHRFHVISDTQDRHRPKNCRAERRLGFMHCVDEPIHLYRNSVDTAAVLIWHDVPEADSLTYT